MSKVFYVVYQSIHKYLLKLKIQDLDDDTKYDIETLCESFESQRPIRMEKNILSLLEAKSYFTYCEKYVNKKLKNKTQDDIETALKNAKYHINGIQQKIGQFLESIRVTIILDKLYELDEIRQVEIRIKNAKKDMEAYLKRKDLNEIRMCEEKPQIALKKYINPSLYNAKNSNILPKNSDIFDEDTLRSPYEITLSSCIKNHWVHTSQPVFVKQNAENIRNIFSVEKSQMQIQRLDESQVFRKDCKTLGESIQICDIKQTDENHVLEVMYNRDHVRSLLEDLTKKISEYEIQRKVCETNMFENVCLNPIMIYSASGKYLCSNSNKKVLINNNYRPNLLVNSLVHESGMRAENLLVFLFIEGGLPHDRLYHRGIHFTFFGKKKRNTNAFCLLFFYKQLF